MATPERSFEHLRLPAHTLDRDTISSQLASYMHKELQQNRRRSEKQWHMPETPSPPSRTPTLSSVDELNGLGRPPTQHSFGQTPRNAAHSWRTPNLPSPRAWQTYFLQEVAGDTYLEVQLLLMTMATGMLDAMTYSTYRVFASKQTGNTLFLALTAFSLSAPEIRDVTLALAVFIAGAAFFGHIGHLSRQRRRAWLLVSQAFQTSLILCAALIPHTSRHGPYTLSLLSLSAAAQIATALNVKMPELNTTMITGALIMLATDKNLFKLQNAARNRRAAFVLAIFVGCIMGAAILKFRHPSRVLVVTAATKGLVFGSFFFNRGIVEERTRVLEDGVEAEKLEGTVTPVVKVLWGD